MSTGISWTDEVWNPVTGCSKVSPGCAHCYAETLSHRFARTRLPWTPENAAENVVLHPERLDQPLRWRKPRRIFVNSMSDLFHEQVPDGFLAGVWAVMGQAHWHQFQVLTKRPERMRDWIIARDIETAWRLAPAGEGRAWVTPNVHLGVSVENQRWADERIPILIETPAAVRFVSLEPLLGPVDLDGIWGYSGSATSDEQDRWPIHWMIVGGESGPGYRPMDPEWVRSIAEQADAAGVPLFVKQGSGLRPGQQGDLPDDLWRRKEMPR